MWKTSIGFFELWGVLLLKLYLMSLEGSCTSAFCLILVLLPLSLWKGLAIARDLCVQMRTEFCSCIEIDVFQNPVIDTNALQIHLVLGSQPNFIHLLLFKPARSPGASVGLQWQKPSWELPTAHSPKGAWECWAGAATHHLLHGGCAAALWDPLELCCCLAGIFPILAAPSLATSDVIYPCSKVLCVNSVFSSCQQH